MYRAPEESEANGEGRKGSRGGRKRGETALGMGKKVMILRGRLPWLWGEKSHAAKKPLKKGEKAAGKEDAREQAVLFWRGGKKFTKT